MTYVCCPGRQGLETCKNSEPVSISCEWVFSSAGKWHGLSARSCLAASRSRASSKLRRSSSWALPAFFSSRKATSYPLLKPQRLKRRGEAPPAEKTVTAEALWNIKQERIARLRAQRERFCRCEKQYRKTLDRVRIS